MSPVWNRMKNPHLGRVRRLILLSLRRALGSGFINLCRCLTWGSLIHFAAWFGVVSMKIYVLLSNEKKKQMKKGEKSSYQCTYLLLEWPTLFRCVVLSECPQDIVVVTIQHGFSEIRLIRSPTSLVKKKSLPLSPFCFRSCITSKSNHHQDSQLLCLSQ